MSLAAVGVIIGAVLPWPGSDGGPSAARSTPAASDSTLKPPPSRSTPATPKVIDEPFDPTAAIPGCATVVQPRPGDVTLTSRFSSGTPSYDNPRFPWFSGPKATAMSNAVITLLPPGTTVDFASPDRSLVFQPITDYDESAPDPQGSTIASAHLTRGVERGSIFLTAQKTTTAVGPCIAGELDARRALPDGTTVDVHDTWREVDGVRTLLRTADATAPDGSRITATADDTIGATQQEHSGTVPLTVDDLARMVTDPTLRVSTPAPPGTPPPPGGCGSGSFGGADGPAVTREQATRLDAVLATIDLTGRRALPLQVADDSAASLCTTVPGGNGAPALHISITGGQPLPPQPRPDPASSGARWRQLPDGTVVQDQNYDTVIATRPSGTRVVVSTDSAAPPTSRSVLETIALTPGLGL
ncbi:MAG: hypothetical protein PGN29_03740 [Gordonia paraffinivorans]